MLEELGVPFELITVDVKGGGNRTPEYLKINPFGAVPAFEDEGQTFFESAAIVSYLADRFPEKRFAPGVNDRLRGRYLQWMFFSMATLDKLIVDYFCHTKKYSEDKRIPKHAEACKEAFLGVAKVLSEELNGKAYFVGDGFTAADLMMGSNLLFAKSLGFLDGFPTLVDYCARLTQRPAYLRAIASV